MDQSLMEYWPSVIPPEELKFQDVLQNAWQLEQMNGPLSQEEFDKGRDDMKNFMSLVLKIAYAQVLSNDQQNKTAKELYESFFPNPKKNKSIS